MKLTYILTALLIIGLIGLVGASTETFQANKEVKLSIICTVGDAIPSSSALLNLTIAYPNGTLKVENVATDAQGSGLFTYNTSFQEIGNYKLYSFCYDGALSYSSTDIIEVTSTGGDGSLTLIIIIFVFAFILFGLALMTENEYVGFIAGLLMVCGGVYVMINGLDSVANIYTQAISYTAIGFGSILILVAGYKAIADNGGSSQE